jgi:hypothetical protein
VKKGQAPGLSFFIVVNERDALRLTGTFALQVWGWARALTTFDGRVGERDENERKPLTLG